MQELKSIKRENSKKENFKKNSGITLIALVITIIVLLILAGVALAALTGDSGILSNSEKAKEQTLKANSKEQVTLAVQGALTEELSKGLDKITETEKLTDELDNIVGTGKYKIEEKTAGWIVEVGNAQMWVTNTGSVVEGDTLGSVYTEEMIGQAINYTTTEELPEDVAWIVIGQDDNGNVLATTNRPLGMTEGETDYKFNFTKGAASWLTYETDLNTKCAELFSGTVQGVTVKAESMNIDHVNALTGFEEPEFNTYTFKDQENNDFENKIVNYWHPDSNGTATADDGTGDPTKWSKRTKKYECDLYFYRKTDEGLIWGWEGNNWSETAEYTETLENLDLIFGENNDFVYALASRAVLVGSDFANFCLGAVGEGNVGSIALYLCNSHSSSFMDYGVSGAFPVRSVVSLSSEFQVKEQEDGTYQLAD